MYDCITIEVTFVINYPALLTFLEEPKFLFTVDMDVSKLLSLEPHNWDFISWLEPKLGFVERKANERDSIYVNAKRTTKIQRQQKMDIPFIKKKKKKKQKMDIPYILVRDHTTTQQPTANNHKAVRWYLLWQRYMASI